MESEMMVTMIAFSIWMVWAMYGLAYVFGYWVVKMFIDKKNCWRGFRHYFIINFFLALISIITLIANLPEG